MEDNKYKMPDSDDYLSWYYYFFQEFPPLLMTMTYGDEFYKELIEEAICSGKPITDETIEKALKEQNIQYDIAYDEEQELAKQ